MISDFHSSGIKRYRRSRQTFEAKKPGAVDFLAKAGQAC
jgi:hypothetical protein